ncbi:MAG: protein kinase [Pyrinomonadaceae bacterium]|nr:protein kinase [Pyrinomonadaceae bacterium]
MNPYWQKIETAIELAPEIPIERRGEWLAEFCAGDAELKAEIKSLLAFENESENFLEKSVSFYAVEILPDEDANAAGKQFGNYTIVREIGRGGMGAVFLAMRADGEFEQQAALKIVRQTIIDAETERHFRRERQILASLNHPNIAKLLDGGVSAAGEPFLVMEFIEGEPLIDYAEKEHLSIEERLRLFVKICSAVQYAHRNLIVHRDLKPSNILVGENGEPKLLDFGLAKVLDFEANDLQTATAFRAMTPAYASPEQLRGEAMTTTSDIYSLGVVLYELLTGARPFDFKTNKFDEIVHRVSTDSPTRPSSVRSPKSENENPKSKIQNPKSLIGDLDNIILTALRKEPERRYQSVEAFADDIERHLKGLPIAARPNTFSYRAEKFIKRNRWSVAAGVLIGLSLLGGAAATVWESRRAETEKVRAEKRFNEVRKLANSNLFEIHPKIENLQGATEAREILVNRALEYLDSLAGESDSDAELQRELAAAYEKVGDVQGRTNQPNLGDMKAALESYQKARTMRENLLAKDTGNAAKQSDLANNYQQMAYILWWKSDTKDAVEFYEKSLAIQQKLVAEEPQSFERREKLANVQMLYGDVPAWNNETEKALKLYGSAQEILQQLSAEQPENFNVKNDLARSHSRLADAYKGGGDFENAISEADAAVAIYEPLIAAQPDNFQPKRGLWIAYFRQCEIYLIQENTVQAAKVCLKLPAIAESSINADPKSESSKHDLAVSFYHVGEVLAQENNFADALKEYEKSRQVLANLKNLIPDTSEFGRDEALNYIAAGRVERKMKRYDAAFASENKALQLLENVLNDDPENPIPRLNIAMAYREIGEIQLARRNETEAENNFRRALEMMRKLNEENALAEIDKKQIAELQAKLK